jgi:hypothetical protein
MNYEFSERIRIYFDSLYFPLAKSDRIQKFNGWIFKLKKVVKKMGVGFMILFDWPERKQVMNW